MPEHPLTSWTPVSVDPFRRNRFHLIIIHLLVSIRVSYHFDVYLFVAIHFSVFPTSYFFGSIFVFVQIFDIENIYSFLICKFFSFVSRRFYLVQGVLRKMSTKGSSVADSAVGKKRWATLTGGTLTYYHDLRVS